MLHFINTLVGGEWKTMQIPPQMLPAAPLVLAAPGSKHLGWGFFANSYHGITRNSPNFQVRFATLASRWSLPFLRNLLPFHNPQSTISSKNPSNSPQTKKNLTTRKKHKYLSWKVFFEVWAFFRQTIISSFFQHLCRRHSPGTPTVVTFHLRTTSSDFPPEAPASGAPFRRPLLARCPVWCCPTVGPRRPSPRLAPKRGWQGW